MEKGAILDHPPAAVYLTAFRVAGPAKFVYCCHIVMTTSPLRVTRIQTGIRIERRMYKVLKGLAEYLDMSIGDLLEGIVLAAFEGKGPFEPRTLETIARLKAVYGMDYGTEASHRMIEGDDRDAHDRPR